VYVYVIEDAPMISCPQQELWVSVGDRAVLSCSVSANPGSLLTWMRSVGRIMEHITDPTVNVSIKVRSSSQWLLRLGIQMCNGHLLHYKNCANYFFLSFKFI